MDCRNWELTAPWTGAQVKVPVKFIVGDLDMIYTTPGMKEYVHGGGFKNDVPLLEEPVVLEGATHFLNQERAEEVNALIHDFIKKFWIAYASFLHVHGHFNPEFLITSHWDIRLSMS